MPDSAVAPLAADDFDAFVAGPRPVLVDFWTDGCHACAQLAGTVRELAAEFAGQVGFGAVNAAEQPELAARYAVASVPTLIFFISGKPVRRLVGGRPKRHIERELTEIAATSPIDPSETGSLGSSK